ncbi:MAG: DUF3795 domain-containing protein [Planctomycetota bacterium]
MEPIISKCGYRCDLCPVYETNFKLDPDKKKMCDAWNKYLGGNLEPDAIEICRGCQEGEGDPDCDVQKCAQERKLVNCAHCSDFACDKLKARMNLVEEKVKGLPNIPEEDYDLFIKPFLGEQCLLKIRESLET